MGGLEAAGMSQDMALRRMQKVIDIISKGGELLTAMEAFTSNMVGTLDAALAFLQDIRYEKIKCSYELMKALHEVERVLQLADELFARVKDFFHFTESDTMTAATAGLHSSSDTKHLCDLMGLLKTTLANASETCEELINACQPVITNCKSAAIMCARMERECQKKEWLYKSRKGMVVVVVAPVGVYIALQVFKSIVIAIGLLAIIVVVMCILFAYCGGGFKKREIAFQKIRGDFDSIQMHTHITETKAKKVHGMLKRCLDHIGYINDSVTKENPVMMKDTLKRFKEVCKESLETILQCKDKFEDKLEDFKHRQSACSA